MTPATPVTPVPYGIDAVGASSAAAFEEAYAALAAEFEPRGELERREVIARWLDEPAKRSEARDGATLARWYHLLVARDEQGALAGVRDCHVILDHAAGIATVYLAHVLVLPRYRRTGLGALFRTEAIAMARRDLGERGLPAKIDLVLAAEMEPCDLDDEASIIRLVAYGKDGFAAITPRALPYCQPDFRDLGSAPDGDERARPIPLLAIVRFLGHEGARTLPRRLARAFVTHLYAVFETHVLEGHLRALETRTLEALDAFPPGDVPLLPLPRAIDDRSALTALTRAAVLPLFAAEL